MARFLIFLFLASWLMVFHLPVNTHAFFLRKVRIYQLFCLGNRILLYHSSMRSILFEN
jgi:hypothetical protein